MTLHSTIQPDDDFLLDDGLPCLRRDGKLYYLGDMQPRVLEACRRVEIGFEQLTEKLGMNRPALVLILKGYDPVPLPLKSMIDRLVAQTGLMPPAASQCERPANDSAGESAGESPRDSLAEPRNESAPRVSTTLHSIPVPPPPQRKNDPADETAAGRDLPPITVPVEEVVIPDVVSPDRPGAPHLVVPASVPDFTPGLAGFTPGLRRMPKGRGHRKAAPQRGQFLLT